jgi:hypothetical protein
VLLSRNDPVRWRPELLVWLPVTLSALVATLAFEHWIVHREVILPALATSDEIPPWMWATLFVPELLTCFIAGWRLGNWRTLVLYAVLCGAARELFGFTLSRMGEPGHAGRFISPMSELAYSTPAVAAVYFLVFLLAAESGHEPGPEPSADVLD